METMQKVMGDIIKAEADRLSRVAIKAPETTKIGQFVKYEPRGEYLVALSNAEFGKVLVQPHNCTINLDNIAQADLDAIDIQSESYPDAGEDTTLTVKLLAKQGDKYGIKYIGTPYKTADE